MKSKIYLPILLISSVLIASIFYFYQNKNEAPQLSVQELIEKGTELYHDRPEERIYAQLDKPLYAPGETIWFTTYVRNGALAPTTQSEIIHVELLTPANTVAKRFQIFVANGIAKGDVTIPSDAPGGQYQLKIYSDYQKNDPQPAIFTKKIMIQRLVLPKLKMDLDFVKQGYSPGSKVQAQLKLEDNTNQLLTNHPFDFMLSVDGVKGSLYHSKTDREGIAELQFNLPLSVNTTDVLLTIITTHQQERNSIARTVPVVLKQLAMDFFPEGGDLIASLPNKVAFKAIDKDGRAIDVQGQVIDQAGKVVADVESKHKGMGSFFFTPSKGSTYTFVPTYPTGISERFELPTVYNSGYVLSVQEVNKDAINLNIYATHRDKVSLTAGVRGINHFSTRLKLSKGLTQLQIPIKNFPIGVAQITLFDQEGIARAERLTFVNLHKQLNIDIETNKNEYQPRERVEIKLKVKDEMGNPVSTKLSLSAVDDQLLAYSDDKSSNLLSWMLLEADLDVALEDPAFYFDKKEPKAEMALDHVLMTAGWRRFSWEAIQKNEIPDLAYAAQKKEIAGTVLGADGKPLSGAKVIVKELATTLKTDANGHFKLDKAVDLMESGVELAIAAPGHRRKTYHLAKYGEVDYQLADRTGWMIVGDSTAIVANSSARRSSNPANALMNNNFRVKSATTDWVVKNPGVSVEDMTRSNTDTNDGDLVVLDARGDAYTWIEDLEPPASEEIQTNILPDIVYYRAREFPAPNYKKPKANVLRTDFRSTVFWDGDIQTDAQGNATVAFYNSDAISSFRISTEGMSEDGQIGRQEAKYFTQMPFSLSAKIPVEVVLGDEISIPVFLNNNSEFPVKGKLTIDLPDSFEALDSAPTTLSLKPQERKRIVLKYKISDAANEGEKGDFRVAFKSKSFNDAVVQDVTVIPKGFPVSIAHAGTDMETTYEIKITEPIDGSVDAYIEAYPTTLSEILQGMVAMLREPNGCFEQTSSANYPNILALQYLRATDQDDIAINRKAQKYFAAGYQKLKTYESSAGGFSWFGNGEGNEVITAFGLMQFVHMKEVYDGVEPALIQRTQDWLISRKNGKGGFKINENAARSVGTRNENVQQAYILYALSEAKVPDLEAELRHGYDIAIKTKNAYVKALVANALYNYGFDRKGAEVLASIATENKTADQANRNTAFGGSQLSSDLQTQALVLMALLQEENPDIPRAKSIAQTVRAGRTRQGSFGSTRNTVMALRALTAYAKYAQQTTEDGTIEVYVDQQKVATQDYKKGVRDPIRIDGLAAFLNLGQHEITIKYSNAKYPMPHALSVNWNMTTPKTQKDCALILDTRLEEEQVKTGDMVRLSARITNTTNEVQGTPMAIIGLPAGLTPQTQQLNDLVKNTSIAYYEIKGNNLVFYYEYINPKEEKSINLDLKADFAGHFEAPASSAYLYYADEHKSWSDLAPLTIL